MNPSFLGSAGGTAPQSRAGVQWEWAEDFGWLLASLGVSRGDTHASDPWFSNPVC